MAPIDLTRERARTHTSARMRSRRRRRSGGAVIFIVAMTLAVLAAMGVYALRSASLEVRTSGYGRQAAQAHYLSEYGVVAAAETINADTADLHLGLMLNASRRDSSCLSLPNVNVADPNVALTSKACRRMGAAEIGQQFLASSGQAFPASNPFGPFPLSGDFFIEMTDPFQTQPPEGFGLDLGMCFTAITIAAYGVAQPVTPPADGGNAAAYYSNLGLELARSRITAGPIRRCR